MELGERWGCISNQIREHIGVTIEQRDPFAEDCEDPKPKKIRFKNSEEILPVVGGDCKFL